MTDGNLASAAIQKALNQQWQEAIEINKEILANDPKNIDAINRLGFALMKFGKPTLAKQMFDRVLSLDPYNRIATNNAKRLSLFKKLGAKAMEDCPISPLLFLEEPGKTKIVDCVNVASTQVLSAISTGQEVYFKYKKHGIDIRDGKGTYIAALPDDLAFKLLKFTEAGNLYTIHIRRTAKSCVSLFIREVKRGKKFQSQASFTSSTSYIPYGKDESEKKKAESADDEEKDTEE